MASTTAASTVDAFSQEAAVSSSSGSVERASSTNNAPWAFLKSILDGGLPQFAALRALGAVNSTNITSATTTTLKREAGIVGNIWINKLNDAAAGSIVVYDNTAASGNIIKTITATGVTLALTNVPSAGVMFGTGLTIVTTGSVAVDITVEWI